MDFRTHGEVEAQVSVGGGVQVGRAHPPPPFLLKHQSRARLDLSTLSPVDSAFNVPAEEKKPKEEKFYNVKYLWYVKFMKQHLNNIGLESIAH